MNLGEGRPRRVRAQLLAVLMQQTLNLVRRNQTPTPVQQSVELDTLQNCGMAETFAIYILPATRVI